jgi:TRAP-type mannitol/chloroaromatic compound transport system substrate-binding protein
MYSFYVSTKAWASLPKEYQAAFEAAAAEANLDMVAEYDFKNPTALRRLVGSGVKLHACTPKLMRKAQDASFDLYAEEAAKNPSFKKIYASRLKFRSEMMIWHRIAEHSYSSFAFSNPPKI